MSSCRLPYKKAIVNAFTIYGIGNGRESLVQ